MTADSTTANHSAQRRTDLAAALIRLGAILPETALYDDDDDEDILIHGFQASSVDALVEQLSRSYPGHVLSLFVIEILRRAERYDDRCWIDTDQRAVLALQLNALADIGTARPFNELVAVPARRTGLRRLVPPFLRK
jgi:hypothetical protein